MTGPGTEVSPETSLKGLLVAAFEAGSIGPCPDEDGVFHGLLEKTGWPEGVRAHIQAVWALRPNRLVGVIGRFLENRQLARRKDFLQCLEGEVRRAIGSPWTTCDPTSKLEEIGRKLRNPAPPPEFEFAGRLIRKEAARRRSGGGKSCPDSGFHVPPPRLSPGIPLVENCSGRVFLTGWGDESEGFPWEAEYLRADETRGSCDAVLEHAGKFGWELKARPALILRDWLGLLIDGPSLGLSLWVHILLRQGGIVLPSPVAATGGVLPGGGLETVSEDSFDDKVEVALATGYGQVLVPEGNLRKSPWKKDGRVLGFGHLDEVRNWVLARAAGGRPDERIRGFLAGKWEFAGGIEAMPGIEEYVKAVLKAGALRRTVREWRREACAREIPGIGKRLSELHSCIGKSLAAGLENPSGEPAKTLPLWETIWPERLYLGKIPDILDSLVETRSGLAEALYLSFLGRFHDHDADLALVGRRLGKNFEDWLAVRPSFRARFSALIWLRMTEPIATLEWLSRLEEPNGDERRLIQLLLEGLGKADSEAFSQQGVENGAPHETLMQEIAEEFHPGFRPDVVSVSSFHGRIADLWLAWFRFSRMGKGLQSLSPIWKHLKAHLRTPRTSPGARPLAIQFPELQELLRRSPDLSGEGLTEAAERVADWASEEYGQVLGELSEAMKKETMCVSGTKKGHPGRELVKGRWKASSPLVRLGSSMTRFFLEGSPRSLSSEAKREILREQPALFLASCLREMGLGAFFEGKSGPKARGPDSGGGNSKASLQDFLRGLGKLRAGRQHFSVISQCLAHWLGRLAGERKLGVAARGWGEGDGWWEIPFLAGWRGSAGKCLGKGCPWRNTSPVTNNADNITISWVFLFPGACQRCIGSHSEVFLESAGEGMGEKTAFHRNKIELRVALLDQLGWVWSGKKDGAGKPSRDEDPGPQSMEEIFGDWVQHPEKPLRHELQIILPLLAMAANQPRGRQPLRAFRKLMGSSRNFQGLLGRCPPPESGARFLVRYLGIFHPEGSQENDFRTCWDADRLRSFLGSPTDVEILQSIKLLELGLRGTPEEVRRFLALNVDDLPNLLFFSR